jgi:hypothetical protein
LVLKVREEHRIGKDWKGLDSRWAKEEGLFGSKSVGLMKVLFAPDAASSHSRLICHWLLSSVASWEGPEKLELSELILNPILGSVVLSLMQCRFKTIKFASAGVRCCGLIPRRWDEALADRIVCVQVGGIDECSVAPDAASSQ